MDLLTFQIENPNIKDVVGKIFSYNDENYKLYLITEAWGEVPCFLAYGMAINDRGIRKKFLIKCIANLKSKSEKDKWNVKITDDL